MAVVSARVQRRPGASSESLVGANEPRVMELRQCQVLQCMRTAVVLAVLGSAAAFSPAAAPFGAVCGHSSLKRACRPARAAATCAAAWHMGDRKEATASIVINAPIENIWRVWSNFELMPRWQPWISEVVVNEDATSKWTLRKSVLGVPLSFSWTAVELPRVEHKLIQWEATSGLKNTGRVAFTELDDGVEVKMTISYELPSVLAMMFRGRKSEDEGGPVNAAVKAILQRGLRRFKTAIETSPQVFL